MPSTRGAGQQPPLPGSDTDDPDVGGQLMAMAVLMPACAEAIGVAAVAVRPSEPTARAAEITAPAATWLI